MEPIPRSGSSTPIHSSPSKFLKPCAVLGQIAYNWLEEMARCSGEDSVTQHIFFLLWEDEDSSKLHRWRPLHDLQTAWQVGESPLPTIVSIYNFTKGLVNLGNFKYFLRPVDYLLSELCKFWKVLHLLNLLHPSRKNYFDSKEIPTTRQIYTL